MGIDHIYCINLEKRLDRRNKVSDEFEKAEIENVEFFRATDGSLEAPEDIKISKGEYGCSDSHIRIWKDVVEKDYKTALVFEDDVIILPNFVLKLEQVLNELPDDWDYVNLGPLAWRDRGEQLTPMLTRGSAWGAHCYLISNKGARKISIWETKDLRYCQDVQVARSPLDMYYCDPPLANQESVSSSTLGVFTSWLKGDIGFGRTPDLDYLIKDLCQRTDILIFFILVVLLVYFFNLKYQ
jgi:GR25 family glycosyltransferase involved in LPS biosynthesis